MFEVDAAGDIKRGDIVHFWVSHPWGEAPNWEEGRVISIYAYRGDYLLKIVSRFGHKTVFRFVSELKPKDVHVV